VQLARARDGTYGHLVREGVMLLEMDGVEVEDPGAKGVLRAEDVPPIPCGAGPNTSAGEFYSFSGASVPLVFVVQTSLAPDAPLVRDLVASGRVCRVHLPGAGTASYQGILVYPWAGFQGCYALEVPDTEAVAGVASVVVQAGALVSGGAYAPHTPAPQCRVKHQPLKWIKDVDFAQEIASIVDQMPGLYKKRPAIDPTEAPVAWSYVAYDQAFDVPRQLLSWGFFAAWVAKNATAADLARGCEPLRSYMVALQQSEDARFDDDVAAAAGSAAVGLPAFNTAPKMSAAQLDHAMRVFYWAALHVDDATRPIPRECARHILDMYLMFGTVLLKKRAYNFQGTGKRRPRKRASEQEPM
jgi:hypothetical protein